MTAPIYDMTLMPLPATKAASADRSPSLLDAMRSIISAILAHREIRCSEGALHGLDDRTLKDIGLHRSEIGSVLLGRNSERRVLHSRE